MDFFDQFEDTLRNKFHGDFSAMLNDSPKPPRYAKRKCVVEKDSRVNKANGFVSAYVEPQVVPEPEPEELDFKVINLEENTPDRNPVQPEPSVINLAPNVTKSPRGSVLPNEKKGTITQTKSTSGNRKQRRAAKALSRKNTNKTNAGSSANGNRDGKGNKETDSPKVIDLKDLKFGFRLE